MKKYEVDVDGYEATVVRDTRRGVDVLHLLNHGVEIFRADLREDEDPAGQAAVFARLIELGEGRGFKKGIRAAEDVCRKLAAGGMSDMMQRMNAHGGAVYDDSP